MTIDGQTLADWKRHLHDEADAAFLYQVLADCEPKAVRQEVFLRLVDVERRHVDVWRDVFKSHGIEVDLPTPSLRARTMAWVARRCGPGFLTGLLLREEGQEVSGYIQLHRDSAPGAARDAALVLARESAQHARALGSLTNARCEPWHRTASSGFLRNIVYGFNDGLTANFGLVAGMIGADVPAAVVLVSGVAGAIADSLSMGASGYLAAKSESEVWQHEISKERDEIRLMPEIETDELALIYEAKGIPAGHARAMAEEIIADPERALEEKAREELGIGESHTTPFREGWVTGLATLVGAFIPVAPFMLLDGAAAMWTSLVIAMTAHFLVGAMRTFFTGRGVIRSGIDMFVVGLGVAAVGYFVGDAVARLLTN